MKFCDSEVGECIGVLFTPRKIFANARSRLSGTGQTFVENDAIFERGVHSLAVERHDGVGGVADERDLVFIIPGRAANGHERAGWIVL